MVQTFRSPVLLALIPRSEAARVIDASGKTVTPGFIDMHAHLDPLLQLPLAERALRQGVTTGPGGPDGGSPRRGMTPTPETGAALVREAMSKGRA